MSDQPNRLDDAVVHELLEAIRLTQEYAQFPCLPGWSWWDAYSKHRPEDAERLKREWLSYFEGNDDAVEALTQSPPNSAEQPLDSPPESTLTTDQEKTP